MNFHIVRNNESIKDIALIYNLDIDEIKENNKHIRIWEHLTPGLKIRLPEISESLALEIDDVEPFIEDYYPKLSILNKEEDTESKEVVQVIKEQTEPINPEIKEQIEPVQKNQINKQYYYYPYPYNPYYQYYRYYYHRRKPK